MKKLLVVLVVLFLVPRVSFSASPTQAAEAAYYFAIARLAASEGAYGEALKSFEEALRLAPEDGYVRVELATLLARLGRFTVSPGQRNEHFERSAKLASEAAGLAAGDFDLLSEVGNVFMNFADQEEKWAAQATEAFEAARQLRPEELQILLPLGQLYLGADRFGEAVEALRKVHDAIPGNSMAESLFGEALRLAATQRMREGRSRDAEGLLEEILEIEPRSPQVRISLADLQARRGDHDSAVETLRAGLDPKAPELRQRLAYELYQDGAFDQAAEQIDQLLDGEFAAAGWLKVLLLSVRGRNDEAWTAIESESAEEAEQLAMVATVARRMDRDGFDAQAVGLLISVIDRMRGAGDLSGARSLSLELAQLYAGNRKWQKLVDLLGPLAGDEESEFVAPSRLLYAEALTQLGRGDEALGFLPEEEDGRFLAKRAETLLRIGRDEEGARLLTQLSQANGAEGAMQAALVYQRLERYSEAIIVLEKIVADNEEAIEARYFLGSAYERSGQIDAAVAAFRTLLKSKPDFAPALNYLGYMWAERAEKLDEALRMINKAVAIEPDNGAYIDSLGWVHFQRGDLERAREYLARAARLISDDPTIFEHLGDVHSALGNSDRAGDLYRQALALAAARDATAVDQLNKKLAALETEASAPQ